MDTDYTSHTQIIKECFVEKGYKVSFLDKAIDEVGQISQEIRLRGRDRVVDSKHEWGFIRNFHTQYREVEAIFRTYWRVMNVDKILGPLLPDNPVFIYRKAPYFGDKVVKKILDPPIR